MAINIVHLIFLYVIVFQILAIIFFYCNELSDWCPIISSPLIIIQHIHFCCKQIFASLWLQIRHIHTCVILTYALFFCLFSFLISRYNHNPINDKPITMKIRNTLMPDPIVSKNMPNAIMTRP
jgi:hypothetical protein